MREVKVDIISLKPLQRSFDRFGDPLGTETGLLAAIVETYLGDDHRVLAPDAGLFQPLADDGLGFTAHMPIHPSGIDICGVDGVEPRIKKGVKQGKGRLFIRCPAKHVAAEDDGGDGEAGAAEASFFHGECSCCCLIARLATACWHNHSIPLMAIIRLREVRDYQA